jgi:hypothetical protein
LDGTTSQSSGAEPDIPGADFQAAQSADPKPKAVATPQPTGTEPTFKPNAPAEKQNLPTFTTTQTAPQKAYPEECKVILERAMQGDDTVLPELKEAFDKYPEWVNLFGDLTEHARQSQLQAIFGNGLVAKEAVVRKMDQFRASLVGAGGSPLEELLIDRISLDWLATQGADIMLNQKLQNPPSALPSIKAAGQRLDAAHRRLNNGVKTLALIRKLLRPTPSTLDLLKQPITDNDVGGAAPQRDAIPASEGAQRDAIPASEGVPVLN